MWWIALFPLAGIVIGVLLYFLRPMFESDTIEVEEEFESEG